MALTLDLLPISIRYSLGSISYNLAYSIFGGTAPMLVIYLISKTSNLAIPGLYLMIGAIVAAVILISVKKTDRYPVSSIQN